MTQKFSDKQINDFVKNLVKTNEVIWTALCYCEELMDEDIVKYLKNEDDKKLLERIAKSFEKLSVNSDTDFARPEQNDGMLADFEQLGKDINEYRR